MRRSDGGNRDLRFRLVCFENTLLMSHPGACGKRRPAHVHLYMSMVALVVDDSMLIRYSVCRFLEQRGFGVESASNGVEALEILARVQPALIVTDMQMPKMSGGELITAVKSNLETTGIPIIVLARRANGANPPETRANFFIYKDIDIEAQLAKTLDELFGRASRGRGAGQ
jgi:CheY-like chemotaxis protein